MTPPTDANEPRGRARWMVIALVVVATLGGGLTRIALVLANSSPLFLWDDAVIHLEAQYLDSIVGGLERAVAARREERATGQDVFRVEEAVEEFRRVADGVPPTFGRPLHDLLALATMETLARPCFDTLTLVRDADPRLWAVPLTSAIAGMLTIPLAFLLGRRLWGERAGARAAAMLALSGAHLLYSMEGFSEALLIFFLYLALVVHARGRAALAERPDRPLAGTLTLGIVLGAGMLVHFRFSILAAVFLVAEALRAGTGPAPTREGMGAAETGSGPNGWRLGFTRVFWIGVGITGMLALAELPYYVLLMAAKQRGIAVHPKTYLEQVLFVLAPEGLGYAGSLVRFRLENLLTYPFALVYLCGGVVTMLTIVAVVPRRRTDAGDEPPRYGETSPDAEPGARYGAGTAIALFVVPLALYSLTIPLLRYGATSFALVPLFAARALELIEDRLHERGRFTVARWIGPVLMAGALLEGGIAAGYWLLPPNGYRDAIARTQRPGPSGTPRRHVTTTPPISWAIAGTDSTVPISRNESVVGAGREMVGQGARLLLVDSLIDFMNIEGQGFLAEEHFLRGIEGACRRSQSQDVSNPFGASLVHDLELNYRPFLETLALHDTARERRADRIRVYHLPSCVGASFEVLPPSERRTWTPR